MLFLKTLLEVMIELRPRGLLKSQALGKVKGPVDKSLSFKRKPEFTFSFFSERFVLLFFFAVSCHFPTRGQQT